MARSIIRKLLIYIASVFVLSIIVFGMSSLAPGDPLVSYYGDRAERMNNEEREHAYKRLGLNEPVYVRYILWIKNAFQGDYGISFKYKQPVQNVVAGRVVNTLLLGGTGFILVFALALMLGIFCALHKGRLIDRIVCRVGTVTSCIPDFWLSLVLIMIFAVNLKILPASGAYAIGKSGDIVSRLTHIILPMAVVVLSHLWYYSYMIRGRLLEETNKDYVLLYMASGESERKTILRHCVRNIMPTYISIMAMSISHIIEGTYIVEMVFSYPGIGTLAFESARYHDYNMLMYICLVTGAVVILGNITGQFISERIDPRMREHTSITQ